MNETNPSPTLACDKKKPRTITKALWLTAGLICLVLGTIGMVLPILPTTPFLLASAACFCKSSPRMYNWLLNNKYFGEYIKNYKEGKGLPLKNKNNRPNRPMDNHHHLNRLPTKPPATTATTLANANYHDCHRSRSKHTHPQTTHLQKTRKITQHKTPKDNSTTRQSARP